MTATNVELGAGSAGTYNLNSATNAIGNLAANTGSGTGFISLTDGSTSLSIGTFNDTGGTSRAGLTTGTLALTDTGTVSQTATGVVTATNVELGAGAAGIYNLNSASNVVTNLVANTGSGTGSVSLNNGSTSLSISNGLNDTGGTSRSGVTTGTLTLADTGSVSQTGTGVIGANLDLLGAGGSYTFNDSSNSVSSLAGNTGTVSLTDGSALTINTVNSQNSLTATGAVTLIDDSIALTATTGLISASGQTVTLQPLTGGTAITLGGSAAGFDLTAAQLNLITASTLLIGSDGGFGSASGAISLTAAIAPGSVSTLGLLSGSSVSQTTGNTITIGSLYVSGTSETLAANNAVSTVAMKASGAVSFYSTSALTVGTVNSVYGVKSTGGTVLVNTGNNLTLAAGSGAAVAGVGSGSSVQLVDAGTFTNSEGSGALSVTSGGGRWLVWSLNPANDSRGSLAYGFKQYNATYNTTTPSDSTNNGFLYTLAPTVSLSLTGTVTKTYDTNTSATLAAGDYGATTGAVDSDTVTLSKPTTGTYDTATAGSGKTVSSSALSIVSAVNGSATVYGYQTTPASGPIGTINQAQLTYTANTVSQTYGTAIPTFSGSVSGFLGTDNQGNATTGTLSFAGGPPID